MADISYTFTRDGRVTTGRDQLGTWDHTMRGRYRFRAWDGYVTVESTRGELARAVADAWCRTRTSPEAWSRHRQPMRGPMARLNASETPGRRSRA